MSRWYVDTSAALKLLADEPESAALAAAVDEEEPELLASLLLETELRRAAHRDEALDQQLVSRFLEGVSLYEMPPSVFREAGLLPGRRLRSLDALHLATAIRLQADGLLTYDLRMADAASEFGVPVLAPG